MIIGIGSDLIDIRRIEKSLERHGQRFIQRIYTEVEQARSENRAARAASYAKRFAAKEACAKALGTGLAHGACSVEKSRSLSEGFPIFAVGSTLRARPGPSLISPPNR